MRPVNAITLIYLGLIFCVVAIQFYANYYNTYQRHYYNAEGVELTHEEVDSIIINSEVILLEGDKYYTNK